jgi:hypothetical protein
MKKYILTLSARGLAAGNVSTGLMHATPGDMKSFKSSAERIALMFAFLANARRAARLSDSILSLSPEYAAQRLFGIKLFVILFRGRGVVEVDEPVGEK